ncbi:hypothetical protein ACTPOK_20045 [Streptomyces inhibens]|uniref:hypothetical protein n=1 Tax=Streptomyces inhibens TaxID=2293571 RepID=UPI00402AC376
MTENPTSATQAPALRAILRLFDQHPEAPGGYVTSHSIISNEVDLLLDGPSDLESWREALGAEPEALQPRLRGGRLELALTLDVNGVAVRMWAVFALAADGVRSAV